MKQMNVIIIFSKSSIFFIAQLRALESQLPACIPIRFTKKKTEVQKCKVWNSLLTGGNTSYLGWKGISVRMFLDGWQKHGHKTSYYSNNTYKNNLQGEGNNNKLILFNMHLIVFIPWSSNISSTFYFNENRHFNKFNSI